MSVLELFPKQIVWKPSPRSLSMLAGLSST